MSTIKSIPGYKTLFNSYHMLTMTLPDQNGNYNDWCKKTLVPDEDLIELAEDTKEYLLVLCENLNGNIYEGELLKSDESNTFDMTDIVYFDIRNSHKVSMNEIAEYIVVQKFFSKDVRFIKPEYCYKDKRVVAVECNDTPVDSTSNEHLNELSSFDNVNNIQSNTGIEEFVSVVTKFMEIAMMDIEVAKEVLPAAWGKVKAMEKIKTSDEELNKHYKDVLDIMIYNHNKSRTEKNGFCDIDELDKNISNKHNVPLGLMKIALGSWNSSMGKLKKKYNL